MAFFDKLKFWKSKDAGPFGGPDLGMDLGFGADPGGFGGPGDLNAGLPDFGAPGGQGAPGFGNNQAAPDFGFANPTSTRHEEIPAQVRNAPNFGGNNAPYQPQQASASEEQEIKMIYSKLDAIRAMLDTIDMRIKNIERIEETKERERTRW